MTPAEIIELINSATTLLPKAVDIISELQSVVGRLSKEVTPADIAQLQLDDDRAKKQEEQAIENAS